MNMNWNDIDLRECEKELSRWFKLRDNEWSFMKELVVVLQTYFRGRHHKRITRYMVIRIINTLTLPWLSNREKFLEGRRISRMYQWRINQ